MKSLLKQIVSGAMLLALPLTLEAVEDGQIKVSYNWGVTLSQPIKYVPSTPAWTLNKGQPW